MFEAYRVLKPFDWHGWGFAPKDACVCGEASGSSDCEDCTGIVGSGCKACPPDACRCPCHILPERYAGEIWIVEEGNPRKEGMLERRYAVGDASLPPIDELMKDPKIARLTEFPSDKIMAIVHKKNASRASRIKREKLPVGVSRV